MGGIGVLVLHGRIGDGVELTSFTGRMCCTVVMFEWNILLDLS